jgi:plastocyanin
MNSRTKSTLRLIALLLSVAIIVMPVISVRLAADTGYLPLVSNGANLGNTTPTLLPTTPNEYDTPTATGTGSAATATFTATATHTPTATGTHSTATATNTPTATSTATATATETATATPTTTEIPGPATTVTVTVGNNFYAPASVQINPGDTVVWVRSAGIHNVLADDNSFRLGEAPDGAPGSSWTSVSRTFTQAGSFGYHCEFHGLGMAGTVVVTGSR